ncbi:DNA mismatch repair protein Mlh3p [[Candida] anglica]
MPIKRLPDGIRSQIQSQVSIVSLGDVVRELLQNSVDAHATKVEIVLDFKSKSVKVIDNGDGLSQVDFDSIVKQYYTSKCISDGCFGFRGESLYAMATVASVSLNSGNFSLAVSGEHRELDEVDSSNSGTVVEVKELFVNIPVRREQLDKIPVHKLLESVRLEIFQTIAIQPIELEVYRVTNSIKELLFTVSNNWSSLSRAQIYGHTMSSIYGEQVIPNYEILKAEFQGYRLEGIIGKEPSAKPYQTIFLDGRVLVLSNQESRTFHKLFVDGGDDPDTKPYLRHPVYAISITTPVGKEKFEPIELFQDSSKKIFHSFHKRIIISMITKVFQSYLKYNVWEIVRSPRKRKVTPDLENDRKRLDISKQPLPCLNPFNELASKIDTEISTIAIQPGNWRVIKQLDEKFILIITNTLKPPPMLLAVDQHACDERIRVEDLLKHTIKDALDENSDTSIELKQPINYNSITTEESELFAAFCNNFKIWGIQYIILPGNHLQITHLPCLLSEKYNVNKLHPELCRKLVQHAVDLDRKIKSCHLSQTVWTENIRNIPHVILESINTKACRSSIMFGKKLSVDEMTYMVHLLAKCHLPFQCAHGRPSVVALADLNCIQ